MLKPMYYDGSGNVNLNLNTKESKETIIKPEKRLKPNPKNIQYQYPIHY